MGWVERGARAQRNAKYAIAGIVGGFGVVGILVGVLTQPIDSLEGMGWPAAGLALCVLAAFIAREGRGAARAGSIALAWLRDEPARVVWVYVRSGSRDGIQLWIHRDDGKLTSLPLASQDDAAEAIDELKRRLPRARFGYRRDWQAEFHAGQMR